MGASTLTAAEIELRAAGQFWDTVRSYNQDLPSDMADDPEMIEMLSLVENHVPRWEELPEEFRQAFKLISREYLIKLSMAVGLTSRLAAEGSLL
jgi:hypothetical protein